MEQTKGIQGNGIGSFYDYKNRNYDSWNIRFKRTDALEAKYPFYSPYQFAGNKPIANVDLDGNEDLYYSISFNEKTGKSQLTLSHRFDGLLCNCFGAALYLHYKGKTYYKSSFPTSSAGQWFFNDFLDAPSIDQTLQSFTGLTEQQLDDTFSGMQEVGEMREQNRQEHEESLSETFSTAFVYAYAARRANFPNTKKQVVPQAKLITHNKIIGSKGLIGKNYESFLAKTLPNGSGSFKVGGREFDGKYGNNIWYEAKSGEVWLLIEKDMAKFKSDMGHRLKIAQDNGATYELFSNTPIPDIAKQYLDKKGIKYTETQ
ncbi:MAG: hypothetical protein JNM36_13905 [Chitinophagales bacterium]|nr:hypothetical protein [Chitinophagales bacterium]